MRVRAGVSLGHWLSVPVGLHYSWFVVEWLIDDAVPPTFVERAVY
jgi:hypothetical protein